MTRASGRRKKPQCPLRVWLSLDQIECVLPVDHAGLHKHVTEDGIIISWRTA